MALKTRKPTGAVPWPLVLVEGEEKAGKTWACAALTASGKVGRCFWIDLGEGAADEYGAIPGADYEIVEHDGSFAQLLANVTEIREIAAKALEAGEKPVVLIIDTMTDEWEMLKDWATDRARSSKANRAKLAQDPNAEIKVSQNYWNDANARHRKLMRLLKTFPGIVLMTSHGKQVAVTDEATGQPVEGKKEHKVEAQKTLGADASCWIRLFRNAPGVIVGGRSVHLQFRPGEDPKPLAADWSMERVIFDVLRCDPATAHVRDLADRKPDAVTPEQIRDEALESTTDFERVRELYAEAARLGYDDVTVISERQAEELLLHFLKRIGDEKQAAEGKAPQRQPESRQESRPEPARPASADGPDQWVRQFRGRLADTADLDGFAARRGEVNEALTGKLIPARTASELHTEISRRSREQRLHEEQPAPDAAAQPDGGDDGEAREGAWVREFLARLADADAAGIRGLRAEVARAVSVAKVISPQTANELFEDIKKRGEDLRSAA